jgi:hypothetical protein
MPSSTTIAVRPHVGVLDDLRLLAVDHGGRGQLWLPRHADLAHQHDI